MIHGGALGAGLCLAVLLAGPALAASEPATTAEQAALLKKTLAHPSDYDTVFAYVRVSEALGDNEAAIGALERLLFYNPQLTRVKYELGSLYYQVGSYQMAADYFKQALASPDLDADTRARIEAYLPGAEKQLKTVRSWFFLQTGIRYQSNASFTPLNGEVDFGGSTFPIDLSQPHGADWNAFALGQFANDIDFGNQNGDKLETRVSGYLTDQFKLDSLNVGLISGTIGPRLALAAGTWPGLSIKPYLIGSAAWVGGDPYDASGGAGVGLSVPVGHSLTLWPSVDWQHASYANSDPTQPLGTSDWLTASIAAEQKFSNDFSLNGRFSYRRADADNPWQSNDQYSETISVSWRFDPPSSRMTQKWTLSPFAQFTQTDFDEANLTISPDARSDNEWQVGLALDAPVNAHLGVSAAVTYDRDNSNIPNYSYDNWSVLAGPTARF